MQVAYEEFHKAVRAASDYERKALGALALPESLDRKVTATAQRLLNAALGSDRVTLQALGVLDQGLVNLLKNAPADQQLTLARNMINPANPDMVVGHNGNGESQRRLLAELQGPGGLASYTEFHAGFNRGNLAIGLKRENAAEATAIIRGSRKQVGEAYKEDARRDQEASIRLGLARMENGGFVSDQFKEQVYGARRQDPNVSPVIAKVTAEHDLSRSAFGPKTSDRSWRTRTEGTSTRFVGTGPRVRTVPYEGVTSSRPTATAGPTFDPQQSYANSVLAYAERQLNAGQAQGAVAIAALLDDDKRKAEGTPRLSAEDVQRLTAMRADAVLGVAETYARQQGAGLNRLKVLLFKEREHAQAGGAGALSAENLKALEDTLQSGYGTLVRRTAIHYARQGKLEEAEKLLDSERARRKTGTAPDVVPVSFDFKALRRELRATEPEKPVQLERYSRNEILHNSIRDIPPGAERERYLSGTMQLQLEKLMESGKSAAWQLSQGLNVHFTVTPEELRKLSTEVRAGRAELFNGVRFTREQFADFLDLAAQKRGAEGQLPTPEQYSEELISHKAVREVTGGPLAREKYLNRTLQLQLAELATSGKHASWDEFKQALNVHDSFSAEELRALSIKVRSSKVPLYDAPPFSREQFAVFLDLAAEKQAQKAPPQSQLYTAEEIQHTSIRDLRSPLARERYLNSTLQLQFQSLIRSGECRSWDDFAAKLHVHSSVTSKELQALSIKIRDSKVPLYGSPTFSREQVAVFLELAAKKRFSEEQS